MRHNTWNHGHISQVFSNTMNTILSKFKT